MEDRTPGGTRDRRGTADGPGGDAPRYACCLCGGNITRKGADPGRLTYEPDDGDGGIQYFWCHVECLRKAVRPGTPLFR